MLFFQKVAVTYMYPAGFAYALLTYVDIQGEGAEGKRKPVASLAMADLQNEVRRTVREYLTEYMKKFSDGTQIVKKPDCLLMVA